MSTSKPAKKGASGRTGKTPKKRAIPMRCVETRTPATDTPCAGFLPLPAEIPQGSSWVRITKKPDGTILVECVPV